MNIDIEKLSQSVLDEESLERTFPILTLPFNIEVQRVGENVSLFFSNWPLGQSSTGLPVGIYDGVE